MMTLIAAAAVAAAQPAAVPANPPVQHAPMMQMGKAREHKDMDCCKDCCKHMAKMHEGHNQHDGHSGQ
jgi:hypothetical protein